MFLFVLIGLMLCSAILTYFVRAYALSQQLLDIPNKRSSHTVNTARGGGIAFSVLIVMSLVTLYALKLLPFNEFMAFIGAGIVVTLVGFVDDHRPLSIKLRMGLHFLSAIWALLWLGGLPALYLFGLPLDMPVVAYVLAVFYLVWMLNLYNFMDGIDGLAAIEAVTVCGSAAVLCQLLGLYTLSFLPAIISAVTLGFLLWNFPPAKIFMGDAGSGFLGIILAILSLQAAWINPDLLWSWLILLGVFIVDATFTLVRRLLQGDKVYEAHRSHAYQYASRQFASHRVVTVSVAAINCLWLFPLAYLVATDSLPGVIGVVIAYMPLLLLAVKFNAGKPE